MIESDTTAHSSESTFLHSTLSADAKLERARTELLDLSARNRLLNIPRNSKTARTIEVIDEKSEEIFRLLIKENRPFTFSPGKSSTASLLEEADGDPDEIYDLAQPDDDSVNERGILNRHADTKLQTRLTSKGLQKKLLDLYFDAQTLEEEQGVNILFLALGTLKWLDPLNAKNVRYAPLILIPVRLERGNAAEQFKLKWRQEEHAPNLSLETFLDRVHNLKMPSFDQGDEFDPGTYLSAVAESVKSKENWLVSPDDIVLGFFSFSKFLMYRDLDPNAWPIEGGLTKQPLISGLLSDGFHNDIALIPEDAQIDEHILPENLLHIVDCDSSQTLAVHDVRSGRNLVIQGPPGTGKSQTIANVIASAIADGKTVLFVAEKMAALDVVKRRLDQAGVGDACLELHSNKANKRILLDELKRTSELGSPQGDFPTTLNTRLKETRDSLNHHASRMHFKYSPSDLTPFQVIGQLTRLRQEEFRPVDLKLVLPETWSPDDTETRRKIIGELSHRINDIGQPLHHPWNGIGLNNILPTEVERLIFRIETLKASLESIVSEQTTLALILNSSPPKLLKDSNLIEILAERVASAPALSNNAITSKGWENPSGELASLIDTGIHFEKLSLNLSDSVSSSGWSANVEPLRFEFAKLPKNFDEDAFKRISELNNLLPKLIAEVSRLKSHLGFRGSINTISEISREIMTGERVAAAPNVSPDVLAATVWDNGIDKANYLVEAVENLEKKQKELENKVTSSAWSISLTNARQILAAHGKDFFRFFRKDWRNASASVKSILKSPDAPLQDVLGILDDLAIGQKALQDILTNDDFGRAAFGTGWQRERSTAQPLRALVTWMQSVRNLGAEPRLIAARLPDRSAIFDHVTRVKQLLDETRPLLKSIWLDFDESINHIFPNAINFESVFISDVAIQAAKLHDAKELCRNSLKNVPEDLETTVLLLDNLIDAQKTAQSIIKSEEFGRFFFDDAWLGTKSDWSFLKRSCVWVNSNSDIRLTVASLASRDAPYIQAKKNKHNLSLFLYEIRNLLLELNTDVEKIFSAKDLAELSPDTIIEKFQLWILNSEQLSKWVGYKERADKARAFGLKEIVDRLENGLIKPESSLQTFDMVYFEAIFADQVKKEPALAQFDGELHFRLTEEFVNLDKKRIEASSLEVVRAHHRRIPQGGGGVGPLGILRGEMARRRGHMPIRQLMLKAAPAIQAIKPVLMMSPLSVAQFLPPGQLTFDLLVMDEASQIQPVDALGAIARCRQVVVVGDERQLPPTKFFSKVTGSVPEDDDGDGAQVSDIESILGLFTARGLPQRMLRWHYRSRHQSLIAVSNSQFYENKLFIVPSPLTQEAGMGLQFHHLPQGVFDSGNTGTNVFEAKAVAEAIIRHAKINPDLSLGVATFSVKQRRAIQDQLEVLRRLNPETESFFNSHHNEPFFVKNLENIQGDERDVIFISVGYGRNAQNQMSMRFGPLSTDGGERRLNVLISRAKRRCEVFSSITDDDIDLERGKGKGVFAFKLFLHFARTGKLAIAQKTDRDYESVFEVQVSNALQACGYQVHPQVGIAGFFIDLAIADAELPGRYLLGIECDGASYHQSKSARDRDRLRQAVLEDHGWIIHRIWSTDWFQRPKDQLQLAIKAIEAAKSELDARVTISEKKHRAVTVEVITIERETVTEIGLIRSPQGEKTNNDYIEASPQLPSERYELHETPISILADLIEKIVVIEGPVHIDEIVARLRTAWGLKRAGSRIQAIIERAISAIIQTKRVDIYEQFLSIPNATVTVRNRSSVQSEALRKPDMIPPQEIVIAILATVKNNFGANSDEIILSISRMFGFKATSVQLREIFQRKIDTLVKDSVLLQKGGMLTINDISNSST
ncbi:DUF3320 domain-containing protein [Undibacterium sp. TC4M20W]|uniref:DUF3320 domain-containing protein n=1 Tax=Undibacterium sp. TC4M20W TaxID=3413052 RepID=UPI003BF02502